VIEHFYRSKVVDVLQEWRRVLKPGGKLAIECPCLDKIRIHLNGPKTEDWFRLTMFGLYGEYWAGHDDPGMLHKWCYSAGELLGLMKQVGFENATFANPLYHQPARDMRIVARK
jgi:predicted SAM-dependent methyltransferase